MIGVGADMGFVYEPDTYVLEFAEESMAGLEIKVRQITMGELKHLAKYAGGNFKLTLGNIEEFDRLMEFLVANIVSWNLEKAPGEPMPITLDTFMGLAPKFASKIISAWVDVVSGVEADLGKESSPGENQEELESVPMEPLPPNPPN